MREWKVSHGHSSQFCLSKGSCLYYKAVENLISPVLFFHWCIFWVALERFWFKTVSQLFYKTEQVPHIWAIDASVNLTFWICQGQDLMTRVFWQLLLSWQRGLSDSNPGTSWHKIVFIDCEYRDLLFLAPELISHFFIKAEGNSRDTPYKGHCFRL